MSRNSFASGNAARSLPSAQTEKNGYTAVQLGAGRAKVKNTSKACAAISPLHRSSPRPSSSNSAFRKTTCIDVGTELTASHFIAGQLVDVTGTSIGKGFAGAMKRHNFGGLRATHGVSVSHRSHGSTGTNQDPGRVWKGKQHGRSHGPDPRHHPEPRSRFHR